MKKNIFALLVTCLLSASAYGVNFGGEDTTNNQSSTIKNQTDINTILNSYEQSLSLLKISENLSSISAQLLNNPTTVNSEYVISMLRLSSDIGKMANRISEMADRIVASELQIGIMADRILETQKLQNGNIASTQLNILKAQKNFESLLTTLKES